MSRESIKRAEKPGCDLYKKSLEVSYSVHKLPFKRAEKPGCDLYKKSLEVSYSEYK